MRSRQSRGQRKEERDADEKELERERQRLSDGGKERQIEGERKQ